jgi:hypothetical protein
MIRLEMSPDTVTIDVEDDRPGIADVRKDAMLESFVRGVVARNMIARAIVLAHEGGAVAQ